MTKGKKNSSKAEKKTIPGYRIFLSGVVVGILLFWIPYESDFSPIQLRKNPWAKSSALFSESLPTTAPLLKKEGFALSYDGRTRTPNWVYRKLTADLVEKKIHRSLCDFKADPKIPQHIRAVSQDYTKSGFDRGHLCPAADCGTQKGVEDSFLLSNIAPQAPAFNRGYWKKLETHVRDLTKTFSVVHAFSGPLFLSKKGKGGKRFVRYQVIGKNEVAVPTHFFLVLFVEQASSKVLGKAFILPNKDIPPETPFKKFAVSIEEVEKASGTLFSHILS